jgi:hypothetical protein
VITNQESLPSSLSQRLLDLERELNMNFAKVDFPFLERMLPDILTLAKLFDK